MRSVQTAASTPSIESAGSPGTTCSGSQSYASRTSTSPAHSCPSGKSAVYFMSR
ncbi:Uncharacterised protein [Mycobacteroides abscessus]|nr:Uncharacterised protein [Mycobacteroides abscessus]